MADANPPAAAAPAPAADDNVTTLATMFPHIPEPVLRRVLEIGGSADMAATLLLENDWRTFQNAPAGPALPPPPQGDDDEDDDDDDEEPAAPPAPPAEPARKRRKVTTEDKPPSSGDAAYDCLFDDVRTQKSHLQLMNLGPKKLAHTRVALLHSGATGPYDGCGGYWLVPLSLQDLDETWWKILAPHLERKALGRAVEFRSLPEGPNLPDVAFDDLEAAQTRRAIRPRALRRAGAPAESAATVVALVAPCALDATTKVGQYLAQLFPGKCPLHFCELAEGVPESKILTKDWHESHATQRVSRMQEEVVKKPSLLAPVAAKKYRYDVETKSGSDWKVEAK